MTRRQVLERARQTLTRHKIEDAALEAEVLLAHALKITRTQLLTEPDVELKKRQEDTFKTFIKRRVKGEPNAYITGRREFYGLDFLVDNRVLIPRPETEILVEQAILQAKNYANPVIVDVGTGSGAIAVCLAKNIPAAEIYAVDISRAALKTAARNCEKHEVTDIVKLLQGDLLEPAPAAVDIIVANLPYVITDEVSKVTTAGFEPAGALDGGPDGTDVIKRLCVQANEKLSAKGRLLLEVGIGQSQKVSEIIRDKRSGVKIEIVTDLRGIERVVCATLPAK